MGPLKYMYSLNLRSLIVSHAGITLTLCKHVHVVLTQGDLTSVLLEACDETLIEGHAWILLLLSGLRHSLLTVLSWLLSVLLLGRLTLVVAFVATTMTTTASHHSTDSLMSYFRASTEGHTCSHSAHKTTHHATSLGLLGSRLCAWCLCWRPWGCSWGTCRASSEESTTAASAG